MARRRKTPVFKPLPQIRGVDPVCLKLPEVFPHDLLPHCAAPGTPTLADYLTARFYPNDPTYIPGRLARQEIVDNAGTALAPDAPYLGGQSIWYHRELTDEPQVPTDLPVLYEDQWLLVVDKPHFLATTPRGMFVAHTALSLLRHSHQLPALSPVHRLDRPTAGVLVFAKVPQARGPLQRLFQKRLMEKEYEAVAPLVEGLSEGEELTLRTHIHKERSVLQVIQHSESDCRELDLETNAESRIKLVQEFTQQKPLTSTQNPALTFPQAGQKLGLYRLEPHTGKTHQLRAHMMQLAAPIYGDVMYPQLINTYPDEATLPLQLLARKLSFTHPFTGQNLTLLSQRQLALAPASQ